MGSMGRGRVRRDKTVGVLFTWIVLAVVEVRLHEASAGTTHGI